jgi:hypothetical protein
MSSKTSTLLYYLAAALLCSTPVIAKDFDYFETTRKTVRNGMQSMFICNGLFTSQRSLSQIVRRGLDYNGAAFDQWSLVREVLKAFPKPTDINEQSDPTDFSKMLHVSNP